MWLPAVCLLAIVPALTGGIAMASEERPRARDIGLAIGRLPVGPLNAITDVAGVDVRHSTRLRGVTPWASVLRPRARYSGRARARPRGGPLTPITDVAGVAVGHATLLRGEDVRTGVTAVLPHAGNLFREKVPGAVFVGNAFGKLIGSTQVNELGEIETPILLTSTLNVWRVADALVEYMLGLPGNEDVRSINPLVAEVNDGALNDIRSRPVGREEVFAALRSARGGPVEEGSVGAGAGAVAFGFKGGIGTSSRRLGEAEGGWTVGVLVLTNYGGDLRISGAPVGRELRARGPAPAGGSVIVVIATDAPADARNLRRLAARAMLGLGRTGSSGSNGSGDYAIAFSTAPELRIRTGRPPQPVRLLSNEAMSPLFAAVIEATEEAVYNSLFRAVTLSGRGRTVQALPLAPTLEILRRYGALR